MSHPTRILLALMVVALLACSASAEWKVELKGTIEGFDGPECVVIDPSDGSAYVSNIVIGDDGPWASDGTGFISKLKPDGQIDVLRWREETTDGPLGGPKGMCLVGKRLWVNDNDRLVIFDTTTDEPGKVYSIRGAEKLNDLATDGRRVFATDTGAAKIHCFAHKLTTGVPSPPAPNGVTATKDRLLGVSWEEHEVYTLDPKGEAEPVPFGLADEFESLDTVEILSDDTLLVSDFMGNRVALIAPDGKTVTTLIEVTTPADCGLDRDRMLLYVPSLEENKVEIYHLTNPE